MSDIASAFRISYARGTYKVSRPEYDGGIVVPVEVADEMLDALRWVAEMVEHRRSCNTVAYGGECDCFQQIVQDAIEAATST